MEALVRIAPRRRSDGGVNPVGEVICVRDDGWPWSPTERAQFRVVRIADPAPQWMREAMERRIVRFAGVPTQVVMTHAAARAAMRDEDGAVPTEGGVRAIRARREGAHRG